MAYAPSSVGLADLRRGGDLGRASAAGEGVQLPRTTCLGKLAVPDSLCTAAPGTVGIRGTFGSRLNAPPARKLRRGGGGAGAAGGPPPPEAAGRGARRSRAGLSEDLPVRGPRWR